MKVKMNSEGPLLLLLFYLLKLVRDHSMVVFDILGGYRLDSAACLTSTDPIEVGLARPTTYFPRSVHGLTTSCALPSASLETSPTDTNIQSKSSTNRW